ncbi:hypothetical protein PROFUN_07025 [Planoprotostelium fungivorum]|uniref:Uncharacterized protein n=1 Tax=Planoprotostelium fungivorum TaxID=1890364 RepID=A0A2P6NMR5_9EUKA|nr:hypothetical protein PROFUN_07025 [Planoprotostelium fungivorum]
MIDVEPHNLCPSPKSATAPKSKDTLLPFYDDEEKSWTAPFMMAPVNRQVFWSERNFVEFSQKAHAYRTAALLGEEHGYSATVILLECSASLPCAKGGFRTPAAAYGPTFIDRLRTAGQDWVIE